MEKIKELVQQKGFEIVDTGADFVVSFGGDGTLMNSEEAYPNIPKIVLRESEICKKCSNLSNEQVLDAIINKKYKIEELIKLEASAKGKTLIGLNDVIVHNKDARRGIRYKVTINNNQESKEIIGDGVVIATPFGSTAYYRSITDSFFEVGLGLAFNNSTEQADHMVLKDDSKISISITRGPALVYSDNKDDFIELENGDSVEIKKAENTARIIVPN